MIKRDYILRMIEDFFQALRRIQALKRGQDWRSAETELDHEFQQLIGAGPQAVAALTETELLAKLISGESTQTVHQKTLMLVSLLKEAGDVAIGQGRIQEGNVIYLKGLHLLLQALASQEPFEFPEFVPKVEIFVASLQEAVVPLETHALLMQHYERLGEFARAEDELFAMLDAEPGNRRIAEFGLAFYERLSGHSDAQLMAGGLPRPELESGIAEVRKRLG